MMTYYTFINVANDVIFSFLVTQAKVHIVCKLHHELRKLWATYYEIIMIFKSRLSNSPSSSPHLLLFNFILHGKKDSVRWWTAFDLVEIAWPNIKRLNFPKNETDCFSVIVRPDTNRLLEQSLVSRALRKKTF